jgi:hypothetical protein
MRSTLMCISTGAQNKYFQWFTNVMFAFHVFVNIDASLSNPGKVMEVKLGTVKPLIHNFKQRTASISSVGFSTGLVKEATDEMLAVRCFI